MKIWKISMTIALIFLLISFIAMPKTFALSNIMEKGNDFMHAGEDDAINKEALKETSSNIYNILLGIGIGVAVIVGGIIGIQLIFGSVEAKAKVSEALVPYIVGCFVVFGAFGIWSMVTDAGNDMQGDISYIAPVETGGTGTPSEASGDASWDYNNGSFTLQLFYNEPKVLKITGNYKSIKKLDCSESLIKAEIVNKNSIKLTNVHYSEIDDNVYYMPYSINVELEMNDGSSITKTLKLDCRGRHT